MLEVLTFFWYQDFTDILLLGFGLSSFKQASRFKIRVLLLGHFLTNRCAGLLPCEEELLLTFVAAAKIFIEVAFLPVFWMRLPSIHIHFMAQFTDRILLRHQSFLFLNHRYIIVRQHLLLDIHVSWDVVASQRREGHGLLLFVVVAIIITKQAPARSLVK